MRILIIGGGLFGCSLALELAETNHFDVTLVEKGNALLKGASYANHNRLHLGYHYLRSPDTARQSIEGLLSFLFYFGPAVKFNFPNYYAIAAQGSKSSVNHFVSFCRDVGISFKEELPNSTYLNAQSVESCFKVPEPVFDHETLKFLIEDRLAKSRVQVRLGAECQSLTRTAETFSAKINEGNESYDFVINCSYGNLNKICRTIGLEEIDVELQDVIIPFFLFPSHPIGLTIMDGEFCSVMPKGFNKNEFLLYHVKHSVLARGLEDNYIQPELTQDVFDRIYNESTFYFPFVQEKRHFGYWRAIRAIVKNDRDSRLSEIHTYDECPNFISVLSGKITTCIQVAQKIRELML